MLIEWYLWLKAGHVISVIAWMVGLLYLPRLFVYHSGKEHGSGESDSFIIMERRLLRYIMNPAMIAAWVFGLMIIFAQPSIAMSGWFHAKLLLVILLTGLHMIFARWRRQFENGERIHGSFFYRVSNEAPTVLMIGIVILAVVKPF